MSEQRATFRKRDILIASAAAGAFGLVASALRAASDGDAIRPFHVNIPQEALDELRTRIAATRWPERETAPPPVCRRPFGLSHAAIAISHNWS